MTFWGKCFDCDGTGKDECSYCKGQMGEDCPTCGEWAGKIECSTCDGSGELEYAYDDEIDSLKV